MKCIYAQAAIFIAVCGCQAGPRSREPSSSIATQVSPATGQQAVAPARLPIPTAATPLAAAPINTVGARLPSEPTASNVRLVAAGQPNRFKSTGSSTTASAVANLGQLPVQPDDTGESIVAGRSERLLSLSDALAKSLSENPDLITIRGTANIGAAAVDVAGVYPWNPFVQSQYFPNGTPSIPASPGNAVGQSNYYIWAMQRFELAHQRRHREDSALAALGQMQWNIRQAELTNISQTERLFFTALYQRQLRDLAADTLILSDRLAEVVQRRFKAGLATHLQTINAQVAVRQSRRQRDLAEAAYQAALLALRLQLGMPTSSPLELTGDLSQYEWFSVPAAACKISDAAVGDPQVLAQEMAEARPDVLAARSAISMSQANLNLARAARVPDVQAGPIYETGADGSRFLGFRLQRDFPVFNNGSALANQRLTEVQQQRVAYEQLRRRAANEAAAAIDRYERARRLADDAAQEALGSPPSELQQVLAQFEAGNAEIVDVLAVQNNLLQEARSYLDILNEVALSATLVTQTTAIPPERLSALRPPRFPEPAAPEAAHGP